MKRLLGLAAVALLVVVGQASSAIAAPFTPQAEVDYQFALAWWHVAAPPLCGSVKQEMRTEIELEGALGEATEPPSGQTSPCELLIADNLPPCLEREVVVHEVGHLLGYPHSEAGIMAPGGTGQFCEPKSTRQRRSHHRRHHHARNGVKLSVARGFD